MALRRLWACFRSPAQLRLLQLRRPRRLRSEGGRRRLDLVQLHGGRQRQPLTQQLAQQSQLVRLARLLALMQVLA